MNFLRSIAPAYQIIVYVTYMWLYVAFSRSLVACQTPHRCSPGCHHHRQSDNWHLVNIIFGKEPRIPAVICVVLLENSISLILSTLLNVRIFAILLIILVYFALKVCYNLRMQFIYMLIFACICSEQGCWMCSR